MRTMRLWARAILVALAGPVPAWGQRPQPKASVDFYDDPLPKGAIARLGTVRFHRLGPRTPWSSLSYMAVFGPAAADRNPGAADRQRSQRVTLNGLIPSPTVAMRRPAAVVGSGEGPSVGAEVSATILTAMPPLTS
jgi:hypothetical protein